jgi:hypothetical protein
MKFRGYAAWLGSALFEVIQWMSLPDEGMVVEERKGTPVHTDGSFFGECVLIFIFFINFSYT